jgi:hypothetical protein
MALQAQVIFAYAFSAGGYWMGQVAFQPGVFTKFEWSSKDGETVELERAFLKKAEEGKEWWRATWGTKEGSWVYEALISTADGTLLGLGAKDADGNTGEVPVSGDTVVYMAVSGEGQVDWWITDKVPGGVVKNLGND